MPTHSLGGDWTETKLNCVRQYAEAWSKIMANKATQFGWRTRYIDAFSGTGTYAPKKRGGLEPETDDFLDTPDELNTLRKGSASIAIEMAPPFNRIDLIEKNPSFVDELRQLARGELNNRVFVHSDDVNIALPKLCRSLTRSADRALAFIDPYGCQVDWTTLEAVAASKVCDVWYLAPTGAINRQLSANPDEIEFYKIERLDRCLGTPEWREKFYRQNRQLGLFSEMERPERQAGPEAVEQFIMERLQEIFAAVHTECLQLRNARNGHLFSLCFAVSNPSKAAQSAALNVAKDVIKKWGRNS